MTHPLLPLLDILQNPEHPGFAQAAQRLGTMLEGFEPAALPLHQQGVVMSKLGTAIAAIQAAQALTGSELTLTQTRARALQSYSRIK